MRRGKRRYAQQQPAVGIAVGLARATGASLELLDVAVLAPALDTEGVLVEHAGAEVFDRLVKP